MASHMSQDVERNRLPNLWEVLSRQTKAPVDLYSFYIYMRDTQRAVDYLDFWLDVSQHMSLCRHYVRNLRRSVLHETPEAELNSKRSSALLQDMTRMHGLDDEDDGLIGPSNRDRKSSSNQRLSAFLRDNSTRHSPSHSHGSEASMRADHPPTTFLNSTHTNTPANELATPRNAVNRADIRASAEKILYTYLLSGSEREIMLPRNILDDITRSIEEDGRDDPEVFDGAKDYVFQAMERDAFPGFLRQKALGNIVQPSMLIRMIIGLISLFAALWTAFILIFLDYSRTTRCWLILPFTIGVYCLVSHQYMLDPILALAGYSEYTFMSFQRIREPFVRKMLTKRPMTCLGVIVVITAALCCLFILVPGKRL